MDEKKSIASILWQQITTTFALAIITASIAGWVMGDATGMGNEGFFRLGSAGMAYQSIAQMFGLTTVLSILIVLLTDDRFFKKVMLLWRIVLLLFLCTVTSAAFALTFRWIPHDSWEAWTAFLGAFIGSFLLGFLAALIKTKIDDRRYERQLSNYKMKQKKETNY